MKVEPSGTGRSQSFQLVAGTDKPLNYGLALSPDERTLIYAQIDYTGLDIRLARMTR